MRGPARLLVLLAVRRRGGGRGGDRSIRARRSRTSSWRMCGRSLPDEEAARHCSRAWRADPGATPPTSRSPPPTSSARATLREPAFVGRAEAVLAPLVVKPERQRRACGACMRRSCSTGTSSRPRRRCSIDMLRDNPHDADARLLRASVRLVRGDFRGRARRLRATRGGRRQRARSASPASPRRSPGSGDLDARWRCCSATAADGASAPMPYACLSARRRAPNCASARSDLERRHRRLPRGADARAATTIRFARRSRTRCAARGDDGDARDAARDRQAQSRVAGAKRRVVAKARSARALTARADAWLALEAARGDAVHDREAAMLALANANPARALAAARSEFRTAARAARRARAGACRLAARDAQAHRSPARSGCVETGYRDAVTESILDGAARS